MGSALVNHRPLTRGYGVVFELGEGREVAGIYLGKKNDQYWLNILDGEIYIDVANVHKIQRVTCQKAAFLVLQSRIDTSNAQDHWRMSRWAQKRNMKPEALMEAKAAASIGHKDADLFVARPNWPYPTNA